MIPHKKQQQTHQIRTPTTTTTASMNMKAENVNVEIKNNNNNNNNTHVKTTKLVRASNKSRENKYVQTQLTAVSNERELKVFTSDHYSDKTPLAGKTSHHNYCQGLTTSSDTTSAAERRAQLRADFFKTSSTLVAEAKDNNNWLKFQTGENTVAKQKLCLEQKKQHSRAFQRTQLTRKQYFPKVQELVAKFEKQGQKTMIVNNMAANDDTKEHVALKPQIRKQQQQKQLHSPLSDEGCNLAQSPYCSSDEDNESNCTASTAIERPFRRKEKVARSASSDSALGLEVDETTGEIVAVPPNPETQTRRRMTLTVTDLPLRQALLPLAEPHALPDLQQTLQNLMTQTAKPSKVLLEERVVELPIDEPLCPVAGSRRESAQSCMSDYPPSECSGVRYMRTPSVVVSDYSDDIMCGITLEEIEYFRAQRVGRRCSSLDTTGTEKDGELHSDVSAASSCSNLYYCGSTISALDGSECYVNGERMPLKRKSSDCSDSSAAAELEDITTTKATIATNQTDLCALLAAQHLDRKSASAKKVGLTPMVVVSNADNN